MNRRAFLARLGFGTVAAAAAANGILDVDKLLWLPGEKTIFVPPPPTIAPLSAMLAKGDIFTISGHFAINPTTYQPLGYLQQFIVTQDVQAGEVVTIEKISPQIVTDGVYKNIAGPKKRPYGINGRDIKPLWAR